MQAIQVKYLPATDTKGTRVKAWSYSGLSVTLPLDYALEIQENARDAAMALLKKLEWKGTWMGATLPNQDYAFVCIDWNTDLIIGVDA